MNKSRIADQPSAADTGHTRPVPSPAALRQASELRFLVLAAQREGNRQLSQALREIGLTPAQAEVMSTLERHEPLTLATLGRYVICETGSPSRLVDTLVRKGLVEREGGQLDRRVIHLRLSQAGRSLIQQIKAVDQAIDSMIVERLSGTDVEALINALRSILQDTPAGAKVDGHFSVAQ